MSNNSKMQLLDPKAIEADPFRVTQMLASMVSQAAIGTFDDVKVQEAVLYALASSPGKAKGRTRDLRRGMRLVVPGARFALTRATPEKSDSRMRDLPM